jgi:type II secretory pathway pseudopilin PulG
MRTIKISSKLRRSSWPATAGVRRMKDEQGIAMILVLIALAILAIFAGFMFMSSAEEVKISDNSESMLQARFAARAGIDHARELLRGPTFNDLLQGPDGTHSSSNDYIAGAKTYSFRNWTNLATLRAMNINDPSSSVNALPDDGMINTGKVGTTNGTILVPKTGVAFTTGGATTARYFLKVTDNNNEPGEKGTALKEDPFTDTDGIIVVRSVGIARTIAEGSGSSARRNSVAIYEARFQQGAPFFNLGSPAIVIGNDIRANFSGNAFDIIGNGSGPGLATIDTDTTDNIHPDVTLKTATAGKGNITGNCTAPNTTKCIADITNSVKNDDQKKNLLDPAWLYNFVYSFVPSVADYKRTGYTNLDSSMVGTPTNPKITFVDGDCDFTGNTVGGGLLVVTGNLTMGGAIVWDGLVLVIGKGEFWTHGMNNGIYGGLIVAGVSKDANGVPRFTQANTDFDIRGNSNIATYDGSLENMGNGLMPVTQLSMREITGGMDPN